MALLAILAGLLIEHYYDQVTHWRRYDLFHDYVNGLRARLQMPWLQGSAELLVVLFPLLFVVWLLQSGLEHGLWGLLGLLFYIAVLVICLGPRDLYSELKAYRESLSGEDDDATRHQAQTWLVELPVAADDQHRAVVAAGLAEANVRIFGVLFWFVLLGPLGAVLYRGVKELAGRPVADDPVFNDSVQRLDIILDWLPARLTALSYALSGHFDAAMKAWRRLAGDNHWRTEARELLGETGLAALALREGDDWRAAVQAAIDLIKRALVVWVFLLAIMTLTGWLG